MQKIKRLTIWLLETSCEATLLGFVMVVLFGYDRQHFAGGAFIYAIAITMFFLTTGYVVTTALLRTFWNRKSLWQYSTIATGLFLLHFEIMNFGVGGAFEPRDRYRILAMGLCITFVCTLAGTLALRKWTPTTSGLNKESLAN